MTKFAPFERYAIHDPVSGLFVGKGSGGGYYDVSWTDKPSQIRTYAEFKNALEMLDWLHVPKGLAGDHCHKDAVMVTIKVGYTVSAPITDKVTKFKARAAKKHFDKQKAIFDELLPAWMAEKMKPKDYERFIAARRVMIDAGIPVMRDDGVVR